MSLLAVVLVSAACLLVAYRIYGSLLARLLKLDAKAVTPAVAMRDGIDYEPIAPKFLLSQHFSAIAAAGPIVGPILAAVLFGWGPALIWIIVGSILIGGVHDFTSLVASIRHKARSIAEVVREHMSRRSYVLFLLFIWIALVYIIVAFTDLVADSFVGKQPLGAGVDVPGGAVATSSLLYLALPIIMGLLLKFTRLGLGWATLIFLPLVGVAVWLGPMLPLDLDVALGISDASAQKLWGVLLLAYCFAASMVPLWLLLQPRGHIGGYFLLVVLAGGVLGAVFGGFHTELDPFKGVIVENGRALLPSQPLFPILFITVACGACSGFHAIIASGTTSKQLRLETDAKSVGYGSMLLEGMVAVLSVCTVMVLSSSELGATSGSPGVIYAQGLARFFGVLGVLQPFAFAFTLLAFTTFVYDTLDVCTRLGRYILQELTGWRTRTGRLFATAATAGVPLALLIFQPLDQRGRIVPAWKTFWGLFGASNQLLAALTLIGVTVWLWRTYRAWWVWVVTGLPMLFMYVMSSWALWGFIRAGFVKFSGHWEVSLQWPAGPVPWAAAVLLGLAILMLIEAVVVFLAGGKSPPSQPRLQPAPA